MSLTGGTATFADRNVGTDKTVTLTGATLSGADATNYNLTSVSTALANITSKELTGSFTADDKTYDGNADATVADSSLPGVIGTDDVTLEVTDASFDDRNVGTDKTVTADLALSGAAAGNYSLSSNTATTTADITPKELTGSFTADGQDLRRQHRRHGGGQFAAGRDRRTMTSPSRSPTPASTTRTSAPTRP